jgi:hypothetical protein
MRCVLKTYLKNTRKEEIFGTPNFKLDLFRVCCRKLQQMHSQQHLSFPFFCASLMQGVHMYSTLLLCTLIGLVYGCMEGANVKRDTCPHWSYTGTNNGPNVWGELCAAYAKCLSGNNNFLFFIKIRHAVNL